VLRTLKRPIIDPVVRPNSTPNATRLTGCFEFEQPPILLRVHFLLLFLGMAR
jgi:hypothetical protein